MTGLGRCISSISVCSLPRWRWVTLRPKMTVILSGRPMLRLASRSRSPSGRGRRGGKNQVIAVFNLGEEEPGLTAGLLTLLVGEEGCERGQPFLAAGEQVFGGQRVRQFLQTGEVAALEKGLRRLFKIDVLLLEPVGEPVVLIQTEPGGERKIGRQAHEHPSPTGVVHLKVVLHDPALSHLQVPAVLL